MKCQRMWLRRAAIARPSPESSETAKELAELHLKKAGKQLRAPFDDVYDMGATRYPLKGLITETGIYSCIRREIRFSISSTRAWY